MIFKSCSSLPHEYGCAMYQNNTFILFSSTYPKWNEGAKQLEMVEEISSTLGIPDQLVIVWNSPRETNTTGVIKVESTQKQRSGHHLLK